MAAPSHPPTLQLPGTTGFYRGKVRDVYTLGNRILLHATDRISAFDHILPREIPYKGQVLNQMAAYFLENVRDIVPSWLLAIPAPAVAYGLACHPLKVEMVIRGYLAGHAWRVYASGTRTLCGVALPSGMREGDPFPEPIITPTTKADAGHDTDISSEDILADGQIAPETYGQMAHYTRQLFRRGTELAAKQGLILVDTKYEFGLHQGRLLLMDGIHTPDSSRYFLAQDYETRQQQGERQVQLSKEFVREWLMARGFQGLDGQVMPEMPDDFVEEVSKRYIRLYETITGLAFTPEIPGNLQADLSHFLENPPMSYKTWVNLGTE